MSLTPAPILIDVRSATEFAEGHVQGAINLDIENGAFEAKLSSLDKSVGYTLYCRSGRRSAIAAELMATAGFTEVRDLGALETAAQSLGLPIITD
jgi:rhodanese-related sulfurtransferase